MLEVLIAFASGGALAAFIRGAFDIIKARMETKRAFPATIKKMNSIYTLMNELKSEIKSDRILILAAKNGGGVPRPGAHLYMSVLFEVFDSNFTSVSEYWQSRLVDEQYVKVLGQLEEKEIVVLETQGMESGILKETYEAQKIDGSILAKVKEADNNYYFISCSFKKLDANVKNKVAVANYIQKIRELI